MFVLKISPPPNLEPSFYFTIDLLSFGWIFGDFWVLYKSLSFPPRVPTSQLGSTTSCLTGHPKISRQ